MYNFSLIIPHKNIPDLLRRALDSVPKRDDIQIIIVDDNSDTDKVDFRNFPGLGEPNTEVYFTKKGKGAGYARNVGLEHASGKWVFFMDSDDVFTPEINSILDEAINHYDYDLIYFTHLVKDIETSETLQPLFDFTNKKEEVNRFCTMVPWGKIIKKAIIDKYNIAFEEIQYSNDTMFAIKCAYYGQKLKVINVEGYIYFKRKSSLWQTHTVTSLECRVNCMQRCLKFAKKHNLLFTQYVAKHYFVNALGQIKNLNKIKYYRMLFIKGYEFGVLKDIIKDYFKSKIK